MCNNNLRLKSPLTRSTDHQSLLKHRNFDFVHFFRGGGVRVILNPIFRRGRVTKILHFKGGGMEGGTCEVLRPCHAPKIWNVHKVITYVNPIQAGVFC